MAELNIRMVYNLKTGKHDIFVDFESDADALPFEHEQEHRNILQKIIGVSGLRSDQIGELKINRLTPAEKQQLQQDTPSHQEAIAERD